MKKCFSIILLLFVCLSPSSFSTIKDEELNDQKIAIRQSTDNKVKVGVIDSSITEETKKSYNIVEFLDLVHFETNLTDSHGDLMLNIISNVEENCDFYYVEVLNDDLIGEIDNVAKGLVWLTEKGVDIICISLTTTKNDTVLKEAVEEAINKGIIIVSATINYSDEKCFPAFYDGVISVSCGYNPNASIDYDEVPLMNICDIKFNDTNRLLIGTSVYTAYTVGIYAKTIR